VSIEKSKYDRLVLFGPSDTDGHGLPDCDLVPPTSPSVYSWANLIGEMLNIPVHNLASIGASNKEILLSIINADIKKDDLVIVCWTHVHRSCLVNADGSLTKIFPNLKTVEADSFYRLFNTTNIIVNSLLDISHANALLVNKAGKVYHFYTDKLINQRKYFRNYLPIDVSLTEIDKTIHYIDIAEDKMHPGLLSHRSIANYIYSVLNA